MTRTRRPRSSARPSWKPTGRADQPWALVPRIAAVQGSDRPGPRRCGPGPPPVRGGGGGLAVRAASAQSATAQDYTATLLDLGRPPVVGLVEPQRELAGLEAALDALAGHTVRK